jgi:uncharacterized repeat protein (TIGR03809 family)
MTHRVDVARGRDIVARWCNLAERRLEYLTELFESGRWRRFHSERALLENIREAKAAVETWRDLLRREAALDNSAIDMSWLGRPRSMLPRAARFSEGVQREQPRPAPVSAPVLAPVLAEPARDIPGDFMVALERHLVASDAAPSAPVAPVLDQVPLPLRSLDVMQERYPLLRNAL